MVYLVDPATGHLRFAHDAGIRSPRSRAWVRSIELPVGTGMFGRAVAERGVVMTDDYLADTDDRPRRRHGPRRRRHRHPVDGRRPARQRRDRLRRDRRLQRQGGGLQPVAGRARPGARRPCGRGHGERQPHRGARPLARGARQAGRGRAFAPRDRGPDQRRRGPARRSSRAPSTRPHACSARTAPASTSSTPRRGCCAGPTRPERCDPTCEAWPDDPNETTRPGRRPGRPSSRARSSGPATTCETTGSRMAYERGRLHPRDRHPLGDGRAPHRRGRAVRRADRLLRHAGRLVRARCGPARRDRGPGGHHDHDDAADRRARPLTRRPGRDGPRRSRRCARSRPASRSCASPRPSSRTSSLRPSAWSGATAAILDLLDPTTGNLHWAYDDGLSAIFSEEERAKLWISVGVGATGTAVAEDRVVVAGDDLAACSRRRPSRPSSTSGAASTR